MTTPVTAPTITEWCGMTCPGGSERRLCSCSGPAQCYAPKGRALIAAHDTLKKKLDATRADRDAKKRTVRK